MLSWNAPLPRMQGYTSRQRTWYRSPAKQLHNFDQLVV
jgi:hypothetical protein